MRFLRSFIRVKFDFNGFQIHIRWILFRLTVVFLEKFDSRSFGIFASIRWIFDCLGLPVFLSLKNMRFFDNSFEIHVHIR